MAEDEFFDKITEQSYIKGQVVGKYFWAWAKIILAQVKKQGKDKIAYVDLFAGPGRYKDTQKSTPLLVLERAIREPEMAKALVTLFNDKDADFAASLQREINALPGVETLRFKPIVENFTVGEQVIERFNQAKVIPTLFFVDPFGYKSISLPLIYSVLRHWGCDCILFFNYNRVNMGMNNRFLEEALNDLFGKERAERLRQQLNPMTPQERELAIVEAFTEALHEMGGKYVLPFRFKKSKSGKTSHHLIFVSKHVLGYEIMKEIMAKESINTLEGVPDFEYNPATKRQPLLYEFSRPLAQLEDMLLNDFAGKSLTMKEAYFQHHVGKRYISQNYKSALLHLETQGKISTNPPASKRPKRLGERTFSDNTIVTFPTKKEQ